MKRATSTNRTTHRLDPLPEYVRLVNAPGQLRGVTLKARGWTSREGETELLCELLDGTPGAIPARWTDLPSSERAEERPLEGLASPPAWRLLLARAEGVKTRRPRRGEASPQNGGEDVGTARARNRRAEDGAGGGVGDAAAAGPDQVALRLARLLARIVEAERDE